MNRNVAIVIAILVIVVIAGYLIWLRSKVQQPVSPSVNTLQVSPSPSESASPSASPKTATGSAGEKTSTPSSTRR